MEFPLSLATYTNGDADGEANHLANTIGEPLSKETENLQEIGIGDTEFRILPLLSSPKRVLVVGDLILDTYIKGNCAKVAAEAPIPIFTETSVSYSLGGSSNTANNMVALGLEVDCVATVGMQKEVIVKLFEERNINTEGLVILPDFQTKAITRYVANNVPIFRSDKVASSAFTAEIEEKILLKVNELLAKYTYDVIVICDYRNGSTTENITQAIISFAKSHGIPTLVDPKRGDYHKYHGASIIKPNEDDARILLASPMADLKDAEAVCRTFTDRFDIDSCILTMSSRGMALYESKENGDGVANFKMIKSNREANVVDVIGAGDAITAAIAFGKAHGIQLTGICIFAIKCAENVIKRHGTVPVSLIDVIPDKVLRTTQELVSLRKIIPRTKTVVLTTGCFDIIHYGHVSHLRQAKAMGDILIVALNSDVSVKKLKGSSRPIFTQRQRAGMLEGFRCVDFIVMFDEEVPTWIAEIVDPDIFAKGADKLGVDLTDILPTIRHFKDTVLIDISSTTKTVEKIKQM